MSVLLERKSDLSSTTRFLTQLYGRVILPEGGKHEIMSARSTYIVIQIFNVRQNLCLLECVLASVKYITFKKNCPIRIMII